jgi:hypothetical protein
MRRWRHKKFKTEIAPRVAPGIVPTVQGGDQKKNCEQNSSKTYFLVIILLPYNERSNTHFF